MNRLQYQTSPYLKMHANNPVDWYPWGLEAFSKAKNEEKPIFLSIGYSSCHWCGVMEEEIFQKDRFAQLLNENFVCIKVDREERPDIDRYFQEVYFIFNKKGGGWPTSIFLTPSGKPFYAATYIPPEDSYDLIGFERLIQMLLNGFRSNAEVIESEGGKIVKALAHQPKKKSSINFNIDVAIEESILRSGDFAYGGILGAPKFPHSGIYLLLLGVLSRRNDDKLRSYLEVSLDAMVRGGFWDWVEGGFCRYSVDEEWSVPHFEKMLYDNALLCEVYIRAYGFTKKNLYLEIAKSILYFLDEKMECEGLFLSALAADSAIEGQKIEGGYYTFEFEELDTLLGETRLKSIGVSKEGNFHGRNIVRLDEVSAYEEMFPTFEKLKKLREGREYPFVDYKIILSWNAMALKSILLLSYVLPEIRENALRVVDTLLERFYFGGMLYHCTVPEENPETEAFLEDYAYLCDALYEGYMLSLDERYLHLFLEIVQKGTEELYSDGHWIMCTHGISVEAQTQDDSYPSSVGMMLRSLLRTYCHTGEEKMRKIVTDTLEENGHMLQNHPLFFSSLSEVLQYLQGETLYVKATKENLQTLLDSTRIRCHKLLAVAIAESADVEICTLDACIGRFDLESARDMLVDRGTL